MPDILAIYAKEWYTALDIPIVVYRECQMGMITQRKLAWFFGHEGCALSEDFVIPPALFPNSLVFEERIKCINRIGFFLMYIDLLHVGQRRKEHAFVYKELRGWKESNRWLNYEQVMLISYLFVIAFLKFHFRASVAILCCLSWLICRNFDKWLKY